MSALRTWAKVPDPWGEIDGARDSYGDLWRPGRDSGWFNCGQADDEWRMSVDRVGESWENVLKSAPLREVTEQGDRVGPIEITDAMISAGVSVQLAGSTISKSVADILRAALRAGGYEVTGVDEQ